MRAAAVQLTSTADRERNLATADRLTRAAAAARRRARRAAREVGGARHARGDRRRRRAARRARARAGRARPRASWASTSWPARSPSASKGARRARTPRVHIGPDGEVHAVYRKIHMFDVEVGGRTYRESEHEEAGDEIVLSRDRRRRRARADRLLRPALPRAVPDPRRPRRARHHRPGRVHARHDARPLGGRSCAPARSRTRRSSSPPTRSASTPRACAPAGAR